MLGLPSLLWLFTVGLRISYACDTNQDPNSLVQDVGEDSFAARSMSIDRVDLHRSNLWVPAELLALTRQTRMELL